MRDDWLRGIASNPSAPTGILLRLLHDDTKVAWENLCETRDLPQPVIDAIIAHPDPGVGRCFSRNEVVDPGQLLRLLDGPHPNAHEWLALHRRGRRPLPDEIIGKLLAMDRPSHLMTREEWRWELMFSNERRVVPVALTHADPQVRAWGCGLAWKVLPESVRRRLLHDPDEMVRDAAAAAVAYEEQVLEPTDLPPHHCHATWDILLYRRLSRALIDQVLAKGHPDEVASIAYNASIPRDVVAGLVSHPDADVRQSLAARTDLTMDQLHCLVNDPDKHVRTTASNNPKADEAWLVDRDIEVSDGNNVRWQPVPWQAELECSIRKAASTNPLVRREAARDDRLPFDVMRRLAYDNDLGVRVLVCLHHPETPGDALLRAYLEYSGRDRARLAEHANFPTAGLGHLADHDDPQVRWLVARDTDADPEIIDRLTRDPDLAVRKAAARCPRLPEARLRELIRDPGLAEHAAANPALPVEVMLELLREAGVILKPEG